MTDDSPERGGLADDVETEVPASIDFDRLDLIRERLASDERFDECNWRPEYAPNRLVFVYRTRYYPDSVTEARLEIGWFENDDFSIHYHESHRVRSFDQRWDRHPSDHNTREHVHPGPEAPTPGENASHRSDWRDVLSSVLTEIENRQRAFWTE